MSSLARFGSACWTVSSHSTVQNHFMRLLAGIFSTHFLSSFVVEFEFLVTVFVCVALHAALVPDPQVKSSPCILDVDMFHLLVS